MRERSTHVRHVKASGAAMVLLRPAVNYARIRSAAEAHFEDAPMPKPSELELIEAMKADLRDAWSWIKANRPNENLYAFGLYTPDESCDNLEPFACGTEGLREVA